MIVHMKITLLHAFNDIIGNILNLLYPPRCYGCTRSLDVFSREVLCAACAEDIKQRSWLSNRVVTCHSHENSPLPNHYFDALHYVSAYEGVIRECMHNFKYKGRLMLERVFGKLLVEYAERYLDTKNVDWIIPVPLHRIKKKERTFNQAEVLASIVARRFNVRMLRHSLIRIRMGQPQVALPKQKRVAGIRNSFMVRHPYILRHRNILLIDDVFTTGATANECARVIKEAGAKRVEVLTLAKST